MIIYGVAVLAACFLAGKVIGEYLGQLIGIDANVGGVGFSMILLILTTQWLRKVKGWNTQAGAGVLFWSNLYIPVIVAMSAIQNVKGALSSGMIAVLTGIIPTALCFMLVPWLSRKRNTMTEQVGEKRTA
jgi:malonate transporter MadL subunit